VTRFGERAPFSNTGPWVSVAAPGEDGTSFAAPLVSAAAARVLAVNPGLSPQEIVRILEETASSPDLRTDALGFGVIDASAAVALARSVR
jgi:subtilisin family serine protease